MTVPAPNGSIAEAMGPYNDFIGFHIDENSGDGVRGHVEVHGGLLQPYGIVHGGVYASLAESAASIGGANWYLSTTPGGQTVGVSNATHFLRMSRLGDTINVVATPVHRGRTLQLWQVEMTDGNGRMVARSDVRLANLSPDRPV